MASRLLSVTAETILLPNRLRKSFVVLNQDAAINLFIKIEKGAELTVSTTDHDHRISPGSTISLNTVLDGEETIKSRWTIVATSGTPRVSFFETEDVRR